MGRALAGAIGAVLLLASCNGRLEKPPLEILQRDSLIGAGKIIQIKSLTNEELTGIEVTIAAENREMRHTEPRLAGHDVVEIGWKKLDGWQIPNSAEIEVRVEGYLLPVRARLAPEPDQASE